MAKEEMRGGLYRESGRGGSLAVSTEELEGRCALSLSRE